MSLRDRPLPAGEDVSTTELLEEVGSPVHTRVLAFWEGDRASAWLAPHSELVVGRGSDCTLRIEHPSVSRQHARIRGGAQVYVEDLDSANGVRVRGVRIPPSAPVAVFTGDIISLGSAFVVIQPPLHASLRSTVTAPVRVASDDPMQAVLGLIELVARSDLSVLLLGETGVGKTTAAELVHAKSLRAGKPLLRVHCPSFPETLLESELFGHEKGAFTGAGQPKPGLIESADGGTVFLDEIGELPLATQAKLLNVVESREVLRLGSLKPRIVDVRFVAATNRDLEAHVAAGQFRQDLYFRLNGLSIVIPPLRTRRCEIVPLATQFLKAAAVRAGRAAPLLHDATVALLEAHAWPGNVRELRNVMERAVVLSPEDVLAPERLVAFGVRGDLATTVARAEAPAAASTLRDELGAVERGRIERALEASDGNQGRAAKLLGISRRSLIRRMEAYGMPRPRK